MWKKQDSHLFTTKPDLERSGMGFTIMENFMDEIEVHSQPGKGTEIRLRKHLQQAKCYAIKETCQWMWRLKQKRVNPI